MLEKDDHKLTIEQLKERYRTEIDPNDIPNSYGLTTEQATTRLRLINTAADKKKNAANITTTDNPESERLFTVLRDGRQQQVKRESLVVGDVIKVEAGVLRADIRLIQTNHLLVNTMVITGEYQPNAMNSEPSLEDSHLMALNIAYADCEVVSGDGYGVIIATGNETFLQLITEYIASRNTCCYCVTL